METLQLQSSQNLTQLLQSASDPSNQDDSTQIPQSVVMLQSMDTQQQQQQQLLQQSGLVLQPQSTNESTVLGNAATGTTGGIQTVVDPQQIAETVTTIAPNDAIVSETTKGASIESLVQIPMPGSSGSSIILPTSAFVGKANGGATTTQTLLPQVIDLGQLNMGIQSINTSQGQILGNDAAQLLSNYNITLLPQQPVSTSSVTSTPGVSTVSTTADVTDLTPTNTNSIWSSENETLTQLFGSSLGCTVLTIEPSVLNPTDGAATSDKSTNEGAMFVDLAVNGGANSETNSNESAKGDKGISVVKDSGGGDSGDSGPGEMSTAEVLQLLVQSGITIVKSDNDTGST